MSGAAASSMSEIDAELEWPLLRECARGNRAAWRSLHHRYYPVTVAFLRKFGVHELDVEDAAQEVFLQMHRYLPRFRGNAELRTWLYRLCITQARKVRRRRRIGQVITGWLSQSPEAALATPAEFCENTARRRIEGALDRLTDAERSAFILYEMEGLAGKQIAEILKCKEATLWRRLHYARKKFTAALDGSAASEGQ